MRSADILRKIIFFTFYFSLFVILDSWKNHRANFRKKQLLDTSKFKCSHVLTWHWYYSSALIRPNLTKSLWKFPHFFESGWSWKTIDLKKFLWDTVSLNEHQIFFIIILDFILKPAIEIKVFKKIYFEVKTKKIISSINPRNFAWSFQLKTQNKPISLHRDHPLKTIKDYQRQITKFLNQLFFAKKS